MHRWNWKWNLNYRNWECAYANGFVVLAEALDLFRTGAIATGENEPISQFVLYEKDFGWIDVWELTPDGWDHFG
jgi:hypothetical protein